MITKAPSFITSDNKAHTSLEEAQKHELGILLKLNAEVAQENGVLQLLMAEREKIVDIFTTTGKSRAKARKVNGGTKKRKATPDPAAVNRALQDGKQ